MRPMGSALKFCLVAEGSADFDRQASREITALGQRLGLPVDRLVTRTLALEGINEAMDELAEARALRQVVTF